MRQVESKNKTIDLNSTISKIILKELKGLNFSTKRQKIISLKISTFDYTQFTRHIRKM